MMFNIDNLDNSLTKGLQQFLTQVLNAPNIDALFTPARSKEGASIMPHLISDPHLIKNAVPLSPAFPVNSGRMVSRISYKLSGRKAAVLLRPCEIRAFVELTKLKQGSRRELILIGMDCPGALSSSDYREYMDENPLDDDSFIRHVFSESGGKLNRFSFSNACTACEMPFPTNTDINLVLYGADLSKGMQVEASSEDGIRLLETLGLSETAAPDNREQIMERITARNTMASKKMIEDITQKTDTIPKLSAFFERCINCYNCRNMCPVCYCKECVFNTDAFYHQPVQYHQWAEKKGAVKIPSDTVFYHLTRMAHMSHACVGCGQCSNACPSDIQVSNLFKSVALITQDAFEYTPGADENEPPPLSVFYEKEFEDIVGVKQT